MHKVVKHKGVNLLTTLAACGDPRNKRPQLLKMLKQFNKSHDLTKSDWKEIAKSARARLPRRIKSLEVGE